MGRKGPEVWPEEMGGGRDADVGGRRERPPRDTAEGGGARERPVREIGGGAFRKMGEVSKLAALLPPTRLKRGIMKEKWQFHTII